MKFKTKLKHGTMACLIALTPTLYADSGTIDSSAKWISTIGVTGGNNLDFGLIDVASANNSTVIVGTDSSVSGTASYSGTAAAGTVTITASAGETLDIEVNITGNTSAGFDLETITCSYNSGVETACKNTDSYQATSVASDVMEIGGTLKVDDTESAAHTSGNVTTELLTVTVNYL